MSRVLGSRFTWLGVVLWLAAGCAADERGRDGNGQGGSGNPGLSGSGGSGATGTGGFGGNGIGGAGQGGLGDGECAGAAKVPTTRTQPLVELVVDQSSSMNELASYSDPLAGSRWTALREALVGPSGVVTELQGDVSFGLTRYTWDGGSCPNLWSTPAALGNHGAIAADYPQDFDGDNTPTGEALDAVIDSLEARIPQLDADGVVPVILLATDGKPDSCDNPDQGESDEGVQLAEAAATRAWNAGIKLLVLWVGMPDMAVDQHLKNVVRNGSGGQNTSYVSATDTAGLKDQIRALVTGELSCLMRLEGRLDVARACGVAGSSVTIGGNPIACDPVDGYRVVDETHIEFMGAACDSLNTGATVDASFPCDVVAVL